MYEAAESRSADLVGAEDTARLLMRAQDGCIHVVLCARVHTNEKD
jgi:hypothetical protein